MKIFRRREAALLLSLLLLFPAGGCEPAGSVSPGPASLAEESTPASSSSQPQEEEGDSQQAVSGSDYDLSFSDRDLNPSYEESEAVKITLSGNRASVSGSGAFVSGSTVTINNGGVYVISGSLTDGQLIVAAAQSDKIQLVLNGVSVRCENHAALYIQSADKVFLTLAEGTENSLSSGGEFDLSGEDANVDGAVFSRADLTLNGEGSLKVTAEYKHGIVSKDDLVITGGAVSVTANGQGLSGKDCVKVADGNLVLKTQGDGIQSDNSEEAGRGFVYLKDGDFTIDSQTDAVQAETLLQVENGNFSLTCNGGSKNADAAREKDSWGGWENGTASSEEDTPSAKALKAGQALMISGGVFTIDSSDDGIHCNGDITVSGGEFSISSGDDGFHADKALSFSGGTVDILKSYEGLEGLTVAISGGDFTVTSSDDGLNAAGGNDDSSFSRGPGQNPFEADSSAWIQITGGSLHIHAEGDGIDSNGTLSIEGGEIYVSGPSGSGNGALDSGGEATISGGIIAAAGSAGMAQGFSSSSAQCSMLLTFPSAISGGSQVTLANASQKELLRFTPEKDFQSLVLSCPQLKQGETYTLTAGEEVREIQLNAVSYSDSPNGSGMEGGPGRDMGEKPSFDIGEGRQNPPEGAGFEKGEAPDFDGEKGGREPQGKPGQGMGTPPDFGGDNAPEGGKDKQSTGSLMGT